ISGLLSNIGSKVGGLLGDPKVKDAFWMTLASGGDPRQADYIREQKAMEGYRAQQEEMMRLQMEQAQRQADLAKQQQERQQYTQALLAAGSSQNPALLQDPTFQSQLRQKAAAYGDPTALEQGGLLAPMPKAAEETSLVRNIRAMGGDPSDPKWQQVMLQTMTKPQTSINMGAQFPD